MKTPRIDPQRLEQFAVAYAPALLESVKIVRPWLGAQSAEAYTLDMALQMVEAVQRAGIHGIEHYYLNAHGGALRRTCQALGIEESSEALANFIGGS